MILELLFKLIIGKKNSAYKRSIPEYIYFFSSKFHGESGTVLAVKVDIMGNSIIDIFRN